MCKGISVSQHALYYVCTLQGEHRGLNSVTIGLIVLGKVMYMSGSTMHLIIDHCLRDPAVGAPYYCTNICDNYCLLQENKTEVSPSRIYVRTVLCIHHS